MHGSLWVVHFNVNIDHRVPEKRRLGEARSQWLGSENDRKEGTKAAVPVITGGARRGRGYGGTTL